MIFLIGFIPLMLRMLFVAWRARFARDSADGSGPIRKCAPRNEVSSGPARNGRPDTEFDR